MATEITVYIVRVTPDVGPPEIYAICESNTTAQRISKNVARSDVVPFPAVLQAGFLCAPFRMVESTDEDKLHDIRQAEYDAVLSKAKGLGLSDKEIQALIVGAPK